MPTIKGPIRISPDKEDMENLIKKLEEIEAEIRLPFQADNFKCSNKNILKKIKFKGLNIKKNIIEKVVGLFNG